MKESAFWTYLKDKISNYGYFQRIESPSTSGTPDVLYQVQGTDGWAELKYKDRWEQGLGTSAIQRHWLSEWVRRGGNAYLLARIGNVVVLVPGNLLDKSDSENVWCARASYYAEIGSRGNSAFDARHLCEVLAKGVK